MKFLCGNCKAKYQIADEKVSGRTLRMKCRRCGHDILIDGHNMPQSSPPSPSAAPRRSGSSTVSVMPSAGRGGSAPHAMPATRAATAPGLPRAAAARSKPPSGLSADFRRHVAAPPEVPQRHAPYDLWHVAIQDVPVGPMTRDELARKVDAGAVTPASLCWREGMDDWRPFGDLPELAQLLRRSRDGSRPLRGRPPPSVPAGGGGSSRAAPLPLPDEQQEDDGAEPTRITDFTPPLPLANPVVQPMFPVQSNTSPKVLLPSQASVSAPLPSVDTSVHIPAPKTGSGLTTSGGIAVGLLLGILAVGGPMLYRNTWGNSAPAPQSAQPVAPPKQDSPRATAPTVNPALEAPSETPEEKPEQSAAPRTPRSSQTPRVAKPETAEKPTKQLSEEQRRLLERMGGGANDPDLSKGFGTSRGESTTSGPVAAALTSQQLTKVVQDNKTQLQRCYETALRAAGGKQDAAIKISVNVVVGTSGTAKGVTTQGEGLGNMTECIKGAVKRWRFPQASSESEFAFPLVFQPGA